MGRTRIVKSPSASSCTLPKLVLVRRQGRCFLFPKVLDNDGDGKFSRAESKSGFDVIDGFITRKEFRAASIAPFPLIDQYGGGDHSRAEYWADFDIFDHDGDGFISMDELNGPVAPMFSCDAPNAKGDGWMTGVEYERGFARSMRTRMDSSARLSGIKLRLKRAVQTAGQGWYSQDLEVRMERRLSSLRP